MATSYGSPCEQSGDVHLVYRLNTFDRVQSGLSCLRQWRPSNEIAKRSSRNSGKPEGYILESPAVQALGRCVEIMDSKAQRTATPGHGPLGLGNMLSSSPIPGLAPLGFRVPAFQADGMHVSRKSARNRTKRVPVARFLSADVRLDWLWREIGASSPEA